MLNIGACLLGCSSWHSAPARPPRGAHGVRGTDGECDRTREADASVSRVGGLRAWVGRPAGSASGGSHRLGAAQTYCSQCSLIHEEVMKAHSAEWQTLPASSLPPSLRMMLNGVLKSRSILKRR